MFLEKNKKELIALGLFTLFFINSDFLLLILYSCNIDITKFNDSTIELLAFISSLLYTTFIVYVYRKNIIDSFKKIKKNYRKYLEIIIPSYIFGIIIMVISNLIIQIILGMEIAENEQIIRGALESNMIITSLSVCIIAPICEEIVFRKMLKNIFKNKVFFILFSGLIFGFLHIISSITSWWDLLYIIPYGTLGISFAYIYAKTDNILSTIFCHMIHNSFSVILLISMML